MPEDRQTEELRLDQLRRERDERKAETEETDENATETHRRRADKAAYLREQLEKRAEAEREQDRREPE
jgi:hypothetical protein